VAREEVEGDRGKFQSETPFHIDTAARFRTSLYFPKNRIPLEHSLIAPFVSH